MMDFQHSVNPPIMLRINLTRNTTDVFFFQHNRRVKFIASIAVTVSAKH